MIEIKSFFQDWKEVDKEQAKKFIKHIKSGIHNIPESKKDEFIEKRYLRGISVKELLND